GAEGGDGGELLAGEGAGDRGDGRGLRRQVRPGVAAEHAEGQARGAGRVARGHAGVGGLLQLEGGPAARRDPAAGTGGGAPGGGPPPREKTSRRAQPIPMSWS